MPFVPFVPGSPWPDPGDAVGLGDGEGLPLAIGVGVGEGEGRVVDGDGVLGRDGVGVGVGVREGEGLVRGVVGMVDCVTPPTTGGDDFEGDAVGLRVVRLVEVGLGEFVVAGPPESLGPLWLSVTMSVPMTIAATSPTRAIIGRETDRARRPAPRSPPLPGSPSTGSGAVGGRW